MQIRRMLLEGSPVIVTMRPQESPSRRRTLCISSAGFRLTPLRQPKLKPRWDLHFWDDEGRSALPSKALPSAH